MKKLLAMLMLAAAAAAVSQAQAASGWIPPHMVGEWCGLLEGAEALSFIPRGIDSNCSDSVTISAYGYSDHDRNCYFRSVRSSIDPTMPLATKTPGAPVAMIEAKCDAGDVEPCEWRESATLTVSKGLLFVSGHKRFAEKCKRSGK